MILHRFQVESFVAPTPESVSAVNEWLSSNGLNATAVSPAGDWLSVTVPVSLANKLLDTQFSTFTEVKTGKKTIRTLSYSIPAALQGHLDVVHPTIT